MALVLLVTGCAAPEKPEEKAAVESAASGVQGWGFRPMKGARPEFTSEQIRLMDTYGCIYMGKEDEGVYLTFDEGYEAGHTASILDTLKEKGVPAAFFITKDYLDREEALVRRMVEEGHIVGNHTANHPSLPLLESDAEIEADIRELSDAFSEKFGVEMTYFRAPKGEYNERTLSVVKNLGYTDVFWSFAYQDWEQDKVRGAQYAVDKVMGGLHGGAVILLHAVSPDNADALGEIIDRAREKGYTFRSLSEYVPDSAA